MLPWLQTSESVLVSFEAREQSGMFGGEGWGRGEGWGWGFGGPGSHKCTLVESFLRGEVSECVWTECKR